MKPYNNGTWTAAEFNRFIISALRSTTSKWGPKQKAKANARVRRGFYLCECCKEEVPATIPAVYKSGKKKGQAYRKKNAIVDHIYPVVDPNVGFVSWDVYISRMFCELSGFQVLCDKCHAVKCSEERALRTANKQAKKEENQTELF